MRILIFGLPGTGKTTLASSLIGLLPNCSWYNADEVRRLNNDWDFSAAGRIRQARRMRSLADEDSAKGKQYVICDFVAPTDEIRSIYNADICVWMDTHKSSQYEDTNSIFQSPTQYTLRITNFNYNIQDVIKLINKI